MSEMMKCFVMHGTGKVGVMEKPVLRAGPIDAMWLFPPRRFQESFDTRRRRFVQHSLCRQSEACF